MIRGGTSVHAVHKRKGATSRCREPGQTMRVVSPRAGPEGAGRAPQSRARKAIRHALPPRAGAGVDESAKGSASRGREAGDSWPTTVCRARLLGQAHKDYPQRHFKKNWNTAVRLQAKKASSHLARILRLWECEGLLSASPSGWSRTLRLV